MDINNINITETNNGLHQDNSLQTQPKGTYRFGLNAVNETDDGDEFFRSNEESNEHCSYLKEDFVPIGKEYITNNEVIIFSVSKDNVISEIGILKNNCNYEVHVNDEDSSDEDKLGFSVEHQIQATYRLRRGCERTVYFTDDNRKPRYYNFDKPQDFKNDNGTWAGKKFNLIKEYNSIPEFKKVEVLDSGGVLEPGSYNISIQYLDEGLNPSEWIITSPIINIYNDLSNKDFLDINGSINSQTDYINFPATSKSIKVEFDNLDENYPFYRLAFIEATNGTGMVSSVKYTDTIPVSKNFFIYTGENASEEGTQEEILFFNEVIYKANSIEQIENRLVLANTEGKQVNYCKLQKYASRIKADMITKKVITNQLIDPRNTKNPTVHFGDMITGGTGYMPGEIYSFGIVYVFEDGSLSPVFHIPGKNPTLDESMVFSPGPNVYPMDIDNESANNRYIDNDNCGTNEYWGLDSEGETLQGKPVRHHRFPLRSKIGIPLVKEETDMGTGEQTFVYYRVELTATGTITLPVNCTQEEIDAGTCTPVSAPPFQVRVTYEVDGVEEEMIVNIDPSLLSNPVNLLEYSNLYTTSNIVIIKIEEADENGVITDVTSGVSPKGLTYVALPVNSSNTIEGKVYSTEIFGIKFSGVDMPSLDDTNGEKIIGYYIVRNERTENEKTILDSGVLTPTLKNNKYIGHGLLGVDVNDTTKLSKDLFGLIHPEHKFNNREYSNYDYIKQEGNFDIIKRNYSKTLYNDVLDGSSYNSDAHKDGNDDGRNKDGWCLTTINRDNYLRFKIKEDFEILDDDIKERFYLKATESRDINDGSNAAYNISCDNKVGMIQFEQDEINPVVNNLPYVYLGRNISDSYSNFRTLPYYKESINIEKFNNGTSESTIFNGDTYVCPMRYTNTVFWDNRVAKRAGRTSAWNYIIGGLLVAIGTVLLIFGGSGSLVIGAGIAIIGGGALFIASGVERDMMVKAYYEEYAKGLRETALDDWVDAFYKYRDNFYTQLFGFSGNGGTGGSGPSDDEIQWIGDTLTDLWFESTINISLRHKMMSDAPTFLDAPGIIETGNNTVLRTWEYFGNYYTTSDSRYPVSKLDKHINKKLLVYDSQRKDNRQYIGAALGEWYQVNPDYHRKNVQKIFYHLALEYDCCSECQEDFPHRWHWSEQSFQEELTDNYRIFLPNNYKDLEGETGEITNVFKIGNNLFMHTEEALWQIPRNYQERVTDQIISFIGTGSYGEIPAQKVVDDENGNSAGSKHKWGLIKIPDGVLFPSENQRKIYQFNGQQLKPISDIGLSNWFQNKMELMINKDYYNSSGKLYPYNDNPSNPFGSGFISAYDSKKQRVIFTKKDYLLNPEILQNSDFEICINNGQVIYFQNFNQTIQTYQSNGWNYVGLENCKIKFQRDVLRTRTETRQITTKIPNTSDIIVWLDTSGSFDTDARNQIKTAIDSWLLSYSLSNPDWSGTLHYIEAPGPSGGQTERWLDSLRYAKDNIYGGNIIGKDIVLVSFVNEAAPDYHGGSFDYDIDAPTTAYLSDYSNFVATHAQLNSFYGLSYPIVFTGLGITSEYLKTVLAAIKGVSYTLSEVNALLPNPGVSDWNIMKTALQSPNPYPDNGIGGLDQYGWRVLTNRYWSGSGQIITAEQFQLDMDEFLQGIVTTEEIEVEVTYVETEYTYVDGIVIEEPVIADNSWTISYSLKQGSWISWHSYLPNFYISVPDKFYSWKYGNDSIWKHNRKGHYQEFYGQQYPYILEYVSSSNPLTTKVWDYLMFLVEVKKFNFDMNEFYDINNAFFNKIIAYNSRQCSGLMNIKVKDYNQGEDDYMFEQINNLNNDEIIVDRNERNWSINNLRDIRINYSEPIFKSDLLSLQDNYFIDKVLNENSIDYDKDWSELESFRDKYLVVRLIFDNFAEHTQHENGTVKMLMNFSMESETNSSR